MRKALYPVIIVIIAVVGILAYQVVKKKSDPKILSEKDTTVQQEEVIEQDEPAELSEEEEEAFAQLTKNLTEGCEKGEWVDVESVQGEKKSFSGRFTVDVPFEVEAAPTDEQPLEKYLLDGKTEVISTKEEIMGFFEGREVEISGVEEQGKIKPEKIRCAGKETDKDVQAYRQEVMNYVAKNLNTLSPQKGNWEIYDIAWPADDHVYVDYAAVESEDESQVDENVYSLLLQVSKVGNEIKTSQIAFLKMSDNEDEEWVVVDGTDKFKDLEDMDYYEYDEELKKWIK